MDLRDPSPKDNGHLPDGTEKQPTDVLPKKIPLKHHFRILGFSLYQSSDQRTPTNEASPSGLDGQSAKQTEDRSAEGKEVSVFSSATTVGEMIDLYLAWLGRIKALANRYRDEGKDLLSPEMQKFLESIPTGKDGKHMPKGIELSAHPTLANLILVSGMMKLFNKAEMSQASNERLRNQAHDDYKLAYHQHKQEGYDDKASGKNNLKDKNQILQQDQQALQERMKKFEHDKQISQRHSKVQHSKVRHNKVSNLKAIQHENQMLKNKLNQTNQKVQKMENTVQELTNRLNQAPQEKQDILDQTNRLYIIELEQIIIDNKKSIYIRNNSLEELLLRYHINEDFSYKLENIALNPQEDHSLRDLSIIALKSRDYISDDFSQKLENIVLNPREHFLVRISSIELLESINHINNDFSQKLKNVALNPQEHFFVRMSSIRALKSRHHIK